MELMRDDRFVRPRDLSNRSDPTVLFARSYLTIRAAVGIIGLLLPVVLIVGEAYFLAGDVHVRGSISAYYHTAMRDVFVAGLCIVGFLLSTYMAAQRKRTDFTLSLVAGVAVTIVAFVPTGRPGLRSDAPRCGTEPMPPGCSALQQAFGENAVATLHFIAAAVFIVSLGVNCLYFAWREGRSGNARIARVQRTCGVLIVAAVGWVALGRAGAPTVWGLTPLYLGELVSVWAFATSWLISSRDLWLGVQRPRVAARRTGRRAMAGTATLPGE
jgi:hypothetical protein